MQKIKVFSEERDIYVYRHIEYFFSVTECSLSTVMNFP